ncbi:hypothetical protein F4553_007898 [Allocatelliglobosispora scoriae]|uniref:Uncharacterized protein n=1 Tax=Allocatelliglobosispora scoriae TaxID=643052 RepID=A0A841C285_9ACTN|nr:hypothetical protein [Allocatelliglobosispora scoriae]MBB5874464.1 hypothetical protein [Allocatelliglobosispora scoriae]
MPRSTFSVPIRIVLGLLGAGSFGAGVLAVFRTENGTGAAVLLAFGGILLVLAILGNRIEEIEFGGAKLKVRQAADLFAAAAEAEREGETEEAARLRAQAQALLDATAPIASAYSEIRGSQAASRERVAALERVVDQARKLAVTGRFEAAEVSRLLREGAKEQRITAIGMMQGNASLRDFEAVLAALADPASPFEQYHTLRLIDLMVDDLDAVQRDRVTIAVKKARGLAFRRDTDRWELSEAILRRVAAS